MVIPPTRTLLILFQSFQNMITLWNTIYILRSIDIKTSVFEISYSRDPTKSFSTSAMFFSTVPSLPMHSTWVTLRRPCQWRYSRNMPRLTLALHLPIRSPHCWEVSSGLFSLSLSLDSLERTDVTICLCSSLKVSLSCLCLASRLLLVNPSIFHHL